MKLKVNIHAFRNGKTVSSVSEFSSKDSRPATKTFSKTSKIRLARMSKRRVGSFISQYSVLQSPDTHRTASGSRKRFMLYFQFSTLLDAHIKKDMEIALSFSKMGYKSTLIVGRLATSSASDSYLKEVRAVETGNIRIGKKLNIKDYALEFCKVLALLDNEKPDVILVMHAWIVAPLIVLAYRIKTSWSRLLKKPSVTTRFVLKMDSDGRLFSSDPLRVFWRLVLLLNSIAFDKVVIESRCGAERIKKFLLFKGRLAVIPSGYSKVLYNKTRYEEVERDDIILTAARIVRSKGQDTLIRAFARIHTSFPDWKVFVAGEVQDRAYFDELGQMVKLYGIVDKVEFCGCVSEENLKSFYLRSRIFCLPSRSEGFPAAIAEAAALGLPVVSSEAGCGKDLAEYGAFIGPIGDVGWLANTLGKLMKDENLRRSSAGALQSHILSWEDIAKRIVGNVS